MLKSSKSTETQSGKDSNTPYYYVHREEHWRHTWGSGMWNSTAGSCYKYHQTSLSSIEQSLQLNTKMQNGGHVSGSLKMETGQLQRMSTSLDLCTSSFSESFSSY
jgi:hypothetical protein